MADSLEVVCPRCLACHTRGAYLRAGGCPSCGKWRQWKKAVGSIGGTQIMQQQVRRRWRVKESQRVG